MPADPLQLRRLDPEPPVIDVGARVQVSPVLGEIAVVSDTVPVNPLVGTTVTFEVPVCPGLMLTIVGLANIWKSTTCTVIV